MIVATIIEICLVALVFIGIFNESKIADFEQQLIEKIKVSFRKHKRNKAISPLDNKAF